MIPVIIEVLKQDGTTESTIELKGTDLPAPPLEVGGTQRVKKTVYPTGSDKRPRTTLQVLGAEENDIELQGVWKDSRGGDGHAAEMTELLDRIRYEGKPVRVSWDTVSVEGIVSEFIPSIRRRQDVEWKLTVTVGESAFAKIQASPAVDHTAEVQAGIQAALADMQDLDGLVDDSASLFELGGLLQAFVDTVTAIATFIGDAITAIQEAIKAIQTVVNLAAAGFALINKLRTTINRALLALVHIRDQVNDLFNSTWQAATTSPIAVLDGTHFAREISRMERLVRAKARAVKRMLDAMAQPAPLRVHAVGTNDTIFTIARLYYSNPIAWRTIAEANGLKGADLGDKKTLVIP